MPGRDEEFLEQGHAVAVTAVPAVGWRDSSPKAASRLGLTMNCTILFEFCMDLSGEICGLCCSSLFT